MLFEVFCVGLQGTAASVRGCIKKKNSNAVEKQLLVLLVVALGNDYSGGLGANAQTAVYRMSRRVSSGKQGNFGWERFWDKLFPKQFAQTSTPQLLLFCKREIQWKEKFLLVVFLSEYSTYCISFWDDEYIWISIKGLLGLSEIVLIL